MTEKIKECLLVVLLLIFSLFLRWEYVLNTKIISPIRADAYAYTMIAHNLARDHVFTSKQAHQGQPSHETRPPGYVFFLAGVVLLTDSFQEFYTTTLFLQCLLGAGTVVLVYALARFLLPPLWSALAALLIALAPHMIAMSAFLLTESLFTFMLLLSVVVLVWACKKRGNGRLLLAGVILGLAIFVRPILGLFPLLCLPILLYVKREEGLKQVLLSLVLFVFVSYAAQASWSIWRTASLGVDTTQADQLKTAVICGFYPGITYDKLPGMPYREDPNFERLMATDYLGLAGHLLKTIQEDPGRYLTWWLVGKPVMFWSWHVFFSDGINYYPIEYSWFDINPVMKVLRATMLGLHPVLVILSLISIVLYGRGRFRDTPARVAFLLCFLLVAHFSFIFMVLAPFPRYALPLGPELYVMSVFALWEITACINERRMTSAQ